MSRPAPKAAKPTKHIFDPFNSSATGHQRAENRLSGSTSWRESRGLKLHEQFTSGAGGGKRVNDTVGAGSLDFGLDGRTENGGWVKGAKGLRGRGQSSIQRAWGLVPDDQNDDDESADVVPGRSAKVCATLPPSSVTSPFTPYKRRDGSIRESSWPGHHRSHKVLSPPPSPSGLLSPLDPASPSSLGPDADASPSSQAVRAPVDATTHDAGPQPPQLAADRPKHIFAGCVVYVNGSTAPIVGDHKLRHLLSTHGARMSIALGRRTVTHVILGTTGANGGGGGGGLAGSKIQKEIARLRGKGVRFVTADWVIESIKVGRRLPERHFAAVTLAPKSQGSVTRMFATAGSGSVAMDGAGD